MVLEAIEDHQRGWRNGRSGLGDERVARGKLAIEHVMPRKWHTHWPLQEGRAEAGRDRIIHTLGNLTLLTGKLNSKVSNGTWLGSEGKRQGLQDHDVLVLNRELLKNAGEKWTDEAIRIRTQELAEVVTHIWSVPANHRSAPHDRPRIRKKVDLSDLINSGALEVGMSQFPRRKKYSHQVATLLREGQVEVNGEAFSRPSDAASRIVGKRTNGWWFFLTDQASRRSLRIVRRDYVTPWQWMWRTTSPRMTVTTMRTRVREAVDRRWTQTLEHSSELRQVGRGQRLAAVAGRDECLFFLKALRNVPLPYSFPALHIWSLR